MIQNPVIPGFHPDPSVCVVGEDYYLVTSSFQYFPAVPIFHSRDLVNWEKVGHCITRKSQLDLSDYGSSDGIWAPTIRYHNDTFYMIVCIVRRNPWNCINAIYTADDPRGEWSDPIVVESEAPGIDPDLFFDDDGKAYYTRNYHSGIVSAEVDVTTGALLTPLTHLWSGSGAATGEASHIYKRDGWYYLVIAEGGTRIYHRTTIARCKDVLGTYVAAPNNPILCHAGRKHEIQCTGHADLIQAHDGSWWAAFLGMRFVEPVRPGSVLGRETFLAPVTWSDDGWPTIGNGGHVELSMAGPKQDAAATCWSADFAPGKLDVECSFLRNPVEANYSLDEKPGALVLCGSELTLDAALNSPTFLGRRQTQFDCCATAAIEFDPASAVEEAGLTIYMDEQHHYEIFISRRHGKKSAVVRRRIGALQAEVASVEIDEGDVALRIRSDRREYRFELIAGGQETELARGEMRFLYAPEFTGAYFALYVVGEGAEATVSRFEYETA